MRTDPGKFLRRRLLETSRRLLFLAFSLFAPLGVPAQELSAGAPGAAALEHFLDTTRTLRAEFEQELWSSEGQLMETATGTLWLQRPNRFLWSYRTPFEQRVVADGEDLWIYDVELAQVTVSPLDAPATATPAMLLSGDRDVREGFEVLESFRADDIDWVRLAPKLESADFSAVLVGFRDGLLAGLELVDGLDQVTEIRFDGVETNPAVPEGVFQFSPPEGVDVIGLPDGQEG